MAADRTTLWFYVPSPDLVREAPASIDGYWPWVVDALKRTSAPLQPGGQEPNRPLGPYNWTIQTYLYLKAAGLPCRLTPVMPDAGVVFAHSDFFPASARPSSRQFFVELKPDRALKCRYVHLVVVQNRHDPIGRGASGRLLRSAVVDNWPQAGLVPRDPARGDRFEAVGFMGNPQQFLPDMAALAEALRAMGLAWRRPRRREWHDYRALDAVVAVRPRPPDNAPAFLRKPAAKLQNAWRAGVPAVLSREPGYGDLRRSDLDYLEADSVPEILAAIRRLQADPGLRAAMVGNARIRAVECSVDRLVGTWTTLVDQVILPAFDEWRHSPIARWRFHVTRQLVGRILSTV